MRKKVILVIATTMVTAMVRLSSVAQGTLYQLQPGSSFTPIGGSPISLSGTFEWAEPVIVYDPWTGLDLVRHDATALNFQAGGFTFRLNVSPLNDCDTIKVPNGLYGPRLDFCEVVDEFDGTGALLEAGLHLVGQSSRTKDPMVFPSLGLYRNPNELVGEMYISAVSVPEPSASRLILGAMAGLFLRRRLRGDRKIWFRTLAN